MNYGVDAGMQAAHANKLPVHPSVTATLAVPALTRGRIICPEPQVLVIYVVSQRETKTGLRVAETTKTVTYKHINIHLYGMHNPHTVVISSLIVRLQHLWFHLIQ